MIKIVLIFLLFFGYLNAKVVDFIEKDKKAITVKNVSTMKKAKKIAEKLSKYNVYIYKTLTTKTPLYVVYIVNISKEERKIIINDIKEFFRDAYATSDKKIRDLTSYNFVYNGVAVIVNNEIITLYDVDNIMKQENISKNKAINILINKTLYKQEVKKFNLTVGDGEIENYMGKIAQANNMNLENFKLEIKKNQNFQNFIANIKKRLLNQKFINKIAIGKLKIATDKEIKEYYDNNIKQFRVNENSIKVLPLKEVENEIFNEIMYKREQNHLKKYFKSLKMKTDIKIIR